MRPSKLLCSAAVLAGMTAFLARPAQADEWNQLTYFTFSAPVQIPGATLPAGTYAFRLADLNGNRHIVQVFNKKQTHVYASILAIPDDRGFDNPAPKPIVLFEETAPGQPAAVKAWFYPGMEIGQEFVYPKAQAQRIAGIVHQPVLATESAMNNTEAMKSAKVGRVDEKGTMTEEPAAAAPSQSAQASTSTPQTTSSAPAMVGQNAQANGASGVVGTSGQANTNASNQPARLPQTASPFGLIALLSGLSLAGAFGINRLRVRLSENR